MSNHAKTKSPETNPLIFEICPDKSGLLEIRNLELVI